MILAALVLWLLGFIFVEPGRVVGGHDGFHHCLGRRKRTTQDPTRWYRRPGLKQPFSQQVVLCDHSRAALKALYVSTTWAFKASG